MPTPQIDNMPAAPAPTDSREVFSSKTFAFYAAMAGFISQLNAALTWVANQLATIAGYASSTSTASADAIAAAGAAAASAGASRWQAATSYAEGAVVWSPITYRTYRRRSAGSAGADPSVNVSVWELQSDGIPSASMTVTYTNGRPSSFTEGGVTTTITYNSAYFVSTLSWPRNGKTRTETYSYNAAGNVTGMTATEV